MEEEVGAVIGLSRSQSESGLLTLSVVFIQIGLLPLQFALVKNSHSFQWKISSSSAGAEPLIQIKTIVVDKGLKTHLVPLGSQTGLHLADNLPPFFPPLSLHLRHK